MKILAGFVVLILLFFALFALRPSDAAGQVLYPATAYPVFEPPVAGAYPAYATPQPTFIPSPPPDFDSIFMDPTLKPQAQILQDASPEAVVQSTLAPVGYRQALCQRYSSVCAGRRHVLPVAEWKAE